MENFNKEKITKLIENCIQEDGYDLTSNAIFDKNEIAIGHIKYKEDGVVAALDYALEVFYFLNKNIEIEKKFPDSAFVEKGTIVATIKGSVLTILRGERICLNILQRASGIATKTKKMADLIKNTKTKILDTRKTAPGLRFLDKYAVKCGGGENHRMGLDDEIMIKDNHIDKAGGITLAYNKIKTNIKTQIPIIIECRNIDDVKECLSLDIKRIMLDNMSIEQMKECVNLISGKIPVEASGNINENNIADIAQTGVDFVSSGALTHSVKALDISLKIKY